MASFDPCIGFTIPAEGGFVNNPRDPGGATNFGITLDGLSLWRGHPCTVADIKALTVKEAKDIYHLRYFLAMRCDTLPPGLDLTVFDFGVNAGPNRSIKMLQQVLGASPDGVPGPKTTAAAAGGGLVLVNRIKQLAVAHGAYYRTLDTFDAFGRGWLNRIDACLATSIKLATNTVAAPVLPALPKPQVPGYVVDVHTGA